MRARTACVDVPAMPLQLLLRRHPEWADEPAAVVEEDRPQAILLWVNEAARKNGVLPGMRWSAGLSLARELRAETVTTEAIAAGVAEAADRLLRFSPIVEPAREEPGVFWLDASGLARLFPSPASWARAIRADLGAVGLYARVAVGFTRFGSYATARTTCELVVFADRADEDRAARRVPLARLAIDPPVRDALAKLGVHDVGAFLRLPEEGLARRFGEDARRLYRLASGTHDEPFAPRIPVPPPAVTVSFEFPEEDGQRLYFLVKRHLDGLLGNLATRNEALLELTIALALDDATQATESLRPAAPTLETAQILDLAHLKLTSIALPAGVTDMTLTAIGTPASSEQMRLFVERPRRDPAAAARAFARLTAEFGDGAVVRARLVDAHLPEAQFAWDPMGRPVAAHPRPVAPAVARTMTTADAPLVRRILATPLPLPRSSRKGPDGWLVAGIESGPAIPVGGPYPVETSWWTESERREFHFVETSKGALLWLFDSPAGLLLQAQVE